MWSADDTENALLLLLLLLVGIAVIGWLHERAIRREKRPRCPVCLGRGTYELPPNYNEVECTNCQGTGVWPEL